VEKEQLLDLLFTDLNLLLFLPFSTGQQLGLALLCYISLWGIGYLQVGRVPGLGTPLRTPPGNNA